MNYHFKTHDMAWQIIQQGNLYDSENTLLQLHDVFIKFLIDPQQQSSSAALSVSLQLGQDTVKVVAEVRDIVLYSFSTSKFSQLLYCEGKFPKLNYWRGP